MLCVFYHNRGRKEDAPNAPCFCGRNIAVCDKHGGPGGLTTPMAIPTRHLCPLPPGGSGASLSLLGREQVCHPFLIIPREAWAGGRQGARPPGPPSLGVYRARGDPHRRPGCSRPGTGKQGQPGTQSHRLLPPAAGFPGGLLLITPRGTGSGPGTRSVHEIRLLLSCPRSRARTLTPGNRSPGLANLLTVPGSLTDSQHFHRYQRSWMTSGVFGKKEGREGTGGGTRPVKLVVSSSPCRTLGSGSGDPSNFTKWKQDRRCLPEQGSQSWEVPR